MKVLCEWAASGPSHVRTGWKRVFEACGHSWSWHDPNREPTFDAFRRSEPDVFLGTTYGLARAHVKCLRARPHVKVGLFASAWGPMSDAVDPVKHPIVRVGEDEKYFVGGMIEELGKPEVVFVHVTEGRFLEGTMSGWRSIGATPMGLMNAADTFAYWPDAVDPALVCDVAMCGGYWEYKARNLDAYVLPMCHPGSGLDVKLFGRSPWPTHRYLGRLSEDEERRLYASARVCVNVSEPHSTDLGWDVIERPFKTLACGALVVADYVEEATEVFNDGEVAFARSPGEMRELVEHYARRPEDGAEMRRRGRAKVLASETYFDRVAKLLNGLGLPDEAAGVTARKNELLAGGTT